MSKEGLKGFILGTVTIGALVFGTAVAPLWANTDQAPAKETKPAVEARGWGGCGGKGGMGGGMRGFGMEATLEILDMDRDALFEARQEGKTIQDLVEEKGLTMEEFQTKLKAAHTAKLDELVKAGTITEEQAKLMKERMENMPEGFAPGFGPGGGKGFGGGCGNGSGRGMMGGQGVFQVQ